MSMKCLCCGQVVDKPRTTPITEANSARALYFLERLGYTRDGLRTEHRANIDWCWPGFAGWLDRQADAAFANAEIDALTAGKPAATLGQTA
jgi:hypothetical protein